MKMQISKMRRILPFVLAVLAFTAAVCGGPHKVMNVILIITDGMSFADINLAILNGQKIELNGLVTVVEGRIWVPRQAVDLIR